jgi:hypothetical protein
MPMKESPVLIGPERVNAAAAVALTALSTVAGCGSPQEVTRSFWFVGPPRQFRVNSPDAAQGPYSDRWEAQQDGRMVLRVDDDLRNVTRAWLCLELWGGHPGVAAKRVTVNGRTTHELPEVGASVGHCTYSYPQIELRLDDLVAGDNVLEFTCDKGTAFWGHYIVRAAGIRLELRQDHPLASMAPRGCAVRCDRDGEVMRLSLDVPDDQRSRIARVVYRGRYRGYDENGDGVGDDWHGVTLDGQAVDCVGGSSEPPFAVAWDVRMVPDQPAVEVQADIYVAGHEGLVCRTPSVSVAMPPRAARVVMLNATRLPRPFWSRAGKPKECDIEVPLHPANIERAMGVRGLCIYRDETDRDLWRVVTPGRNEVHEPMDEKTWRKFIAASGWIAKPETNRRDGRKVRITVPENDESELFDAVREQLSPHAVASIVAFLQPAQTNNPDVDRQVRWFAQELTKLVGGHERQSRLAEELGL